MHAALMVVALIAFGQLEGAEQDPSDAAQTADSTPDAAQGSGTPDSAEPTVADPPSEISIAPETPPPALADAVPTTAADAAATPDAAVTDPSATEDPVTTDSGAAPAGAASPGSPAAPETLPAAPKPAELMHGLLTSPETGQLAGLPVSLGAALRDATSRTAQTTRAQAYWDLSAAVAQYYLTVLERDELAQLRQGVALPSTAWNDAAADADRRVELTRQSAVAAQLRLYRLMGASAGVSLPLPADAPHCGRYNTRYSEVFAGRQDPGAQQLNEVLPLMHGELNASAALVAEAHAWLQFVAEHRDPATDGTGLLRSYQLMTERRRMFINAVRQYNNHIAQYAELAAPEQIGPDRLVAMLIRVSNPDAASDADSGVEPAGAVEPVDQPGQRNDDARGASVNNYGGQRMLARRPLDFLRPREHSILITPRKLLRLPNRARDRD